MLGAALINGVERPVLHFDGSNRLLAAPHVPAHGTVLAVFGNADAWGRLVGWEDSAIGRHGFAIEPFPGNAMNIVARFNATIGDVLLKPPNAGFEVLAASWGAGGVTMSRRLADGTLVAGSNHGINSISDGGFALHIGGPGDDFVAGFKGDLLALRVFDVQLDPAQLDQARDGLYQQWVAVPEPSQGGVALVTVPLLLGFAGRRKRNHRVRFPERKMGAGLFVAVAAAAWPARAAVIQLDSPGAMSAPTTTIDFEGYPHLTAADHLYESSGVTFSEDDGGLTAIYTPSQTGSPDHPHSGSNFLGTPGWAGSKGSSHLNVNFADS
jgi:hypothetical protein